MRPIAALAFLFLAAACTTSLPPPPVESTRTVAGSAAEVRSRLAARTSSMGFAAEEEGPSLRLSRSNAPADWADCPARLVRNNDGDTNRVDFAAPQSRSVVVQVGLAGAAAETTVSVSPSFTATYRDIYRNLPVEGPCVSTGRLEHLLLDAAG